MFSEERLDLGIDYGTVSTLEFKTSILQTGDGREQRIANWMNPILRFQLGNRLISNQDRDLLDYIQSFHADRRGSYEGFRFRDWSDYSAHNYLGTGDGYQTQYQIYKTYNVAGRFVNRPIVKPVPGTVRIYLNGSETQSGFSIDYERGIVTFNGAPTGQAQITIKFEFDVPVRFEQDKINLLFTGIEPQTNRKIYELSSLTLVETKLPFITTESLENFSPEQFVQSIDHHTISLGYDIGTIGGPNFSTRISTTGGGYEKRSPDWNSPKGTWEIGNRTLNKQELEYLISLFRYCRGRGISFTYFDHSAERSRLVRFGEDSIGFRFDALSPDGQKIFYLSGLNLQELN